MKKILVLGAGRSATSLIHYLVGQAGANNWEVIVGDYIEQLARDKTAGAAHCKAIQFDVNSEHAIRVLAEMDVVISLLPPHFHATVAAHCLALKKHFMSASYVSDEMQKLHNDALASGLLFLNECGLDPGIDHMSAMQVIERIRVEGGQMVAFKSFTGGLIAPGTDPGNPWRYKFTWNPRNVVTAGQGTASFVEQGDHKYIPYQRLFQRTTPVSVPGYGHYEGYANRDSLKYRDTYGLSAIQTMIRGTLRYSGFCSAWNVLVQLGCCDDTYLMKEVNKMTHRSFINAFTAYDSARDVETKIGAAFNLLPDGEELKRLRWSGLFSDELIGLTKGTPAQILEHILSKKWSLTADDQDLIIMWHQFVYLSQGVRKEIQASLAAQGSDERNTAMSKTVGLPLAIAAKLLLQGKLHQRGVVIPVHREYYEPILDELKEFSLVFQEKEVL